VNSEPSCFLGSAYSKKTPFIPSLSNLSPSNPSLPNSPSRLLGQFDYYCLAYKTLSIYTSSESTTPEEDLGPLKVVGNEK
jgi:hypothetical protein